MLVYGGIRMYFSGGSPENTKKATKVMINAVIGLVIVLTSWIVVNTIITFLAKPGSPPTFWTKLDCTPSISNECTTIGDYKCEPNSHFPKSMNIMDSYECTAIEGQEGIGVWSRIGFLCVCLREWNRVYSKTKPIDIAKNVR